MTKSVKGNSGGSQNIQNQYNNQSDNNKRLNYIERLTKNINKAKAKFDEKTKKLRKKITNFINKRELRVITPKKSKISGKHSNKELITSDQYLHNREITIPEQEPSLQFTKPAPPEEYTSTTSNSVTSTQETVDVHQETVDATLQETVNVPQETVDAYQESVDTTLQETVNAYQETIDVYQEAIDAIPQETVDATLQETVGTPQETVDATLQETVDVHQETVDAALQETVDAPQETVDAILQKTVDVHQEATDISKESTPTTEPTAPENIIPDYTKPAVSKKPVIAKKPVTLQKSGAISQEPEPIITRATTVEPTVPENIIPDDTRLAVSKKPAPFKKSGAISQKPEPTTTIATTVEPTVPENIIPDDTRPAVSKKSAPFKKSGAISQKPEPTTTRATTVEPTVPKQPPITTKDISHTEITTPNKDYATSISTTAVTATKYVSPKEAISSTEATTPIEIATSINKFSRKMIGGKGAALKLLQDAGIPVPEWEPISVTSIKEIEDLPINVNELKPFISDIESLQLPNNFSITDIKNAIKDFYLEDPNKKDRYLHGLEKFICSEQFYQQIKDLPIATSIRQAHQELIKSFPNDPLIVRSSGILEDNFGNAQAGKFDSIVNNKPDILSTCLRVYASAFRPAACNMQQLSEPAMANLLQRCIKAKHGGVAMSRSSFQNNSISIESGPGQPQGVVSGQAGVIPHRHTLSRFTEDTTFIEGNITTKFVLQQEGANTFSEQPEKISTEKIETLDTKHLQELKEYILKIENLFLCPVDIEFCVDEHDKLYIVQARPITRLSGGMDFAIDAPTNSLVNGTLVSEGRCSGIPVHVKNEQDVQNIPQGAIIIAKHGQDWMLEPAVLQKVNGFVFEQGGTNDHIAITLRQEEKPCIVAGDQFKNLNSTNDPITLACGNFNGKTNAYVTAGTEFNEQLANINTSSAASTMWQSSSPINTDPFKINRDNPATIFNDLNKLNYMLLDNFKQGEWLDKCFSTKGIQSLCMAPYRKEIIKEAMASNIKMLNDLQEFLDGYKSLVKTGIKKNSSDKNTIFLNGKLSEITQLESKLKQISSEVTSKIENISTQLNSSSEELLKTGSFQQLLKDAEHISNIMQQLNTPKSVNDARTAHDLIWILHKRMFEVLTPAAINSNSGKSIKVSENIKAVHFSDNKEQLRLAKSCYASCEKVNRKGDITIFDDAITASFNLGVHKCTIEMLQQADGGKGKTLKLQLSDNFLATKNYQGKLKRFFMITQMLKNINPDDTGLNISVNEATGMIEVEYSHIENNDKMISGFKNIISVISNLADLDIALVHSNAVVGKNDAVWNFDTVRQKINSSSIENQNEFKFFVFMAGLEKGPKMGHLHKITSDPVTQKYIKYGYTFHNLTHNNDTVDKLTAELNKIPKNEQEEFIYYGVIANNSSAIQFAEKHYPDLLRDKESVINLVAHNGELFLNDISFNLKQDKDVALAATANNKNVFQTLNQTLKQDRDIAFAAVSRDYKQIKNVDDKFKNDKEFALAAMRQSPDALQYLSDEFKNDEDVIMLSKRPLDDDFDDDDDDDYYY